MGHVVITGASRGLGEHLAVEFGKQGHTVGLIARREAELERVAVLVRAAGGKAVHAVADVTDRDAVHAAIARLVEASGPVDVMVANAGGGWPTPAVPMDAASIIGTMRLNFDSVVYSFEAVLPSMLERKQGRLAAVSSVAGWRGLPKNGGYSASKAAVSKLLEAFSGELRPLGITVTGVHPGFIRTPVHEGQSYPLPFMVEPDRAARIIARGVLRGRRNVNFPAPMVALMSFATWVPAFIYEPVLVKLG